ncbi:hypothetical protein GCM10007414_10200 [Agarivorans gilvus]|uniref:Uncharacterized protein n=1 Tax=Agarivorans gilvus TaxID=680279 RepID=A0ABQ1HYL0_9ALTE|nr:hypothetical protein GCM10007414_10200 [Agarivorans gilvus]
MGRKIQFMLSRAADHCLEQFGRDCDFNIALEYPVPFADDIINIGEKSDVYNVGCRWKLCSRLVSRDICGRLVF